HDRAYIRAIEATLPEGAAVFQLPYMIFPESQPIVNMWDYEHLRGYLHSRHLRWSYPAMKGRPQVEWLQRVSVQPVPEMVRSLATAGFQGIYIDRAAYLDGAAALEAELRAVLKVQPLVSPDRRLCFFPLMH